MKQKYQNSHKNPVVLSIQKCQFDFTSATWRKQIFQDFTITMTMVIITFPSSTTTIKHIC